MVTGRQYAEKCMEVEKLVPRAGYIYGASAKGEVWTAAKQRALEAKYEKTKNPDLELSAKYGSKWIGHVVYDCSGLTSGKASELGLKFHHGSNSSFNYDCQKKGKKTANMKLPLGAWVYTGSASKHGHIGVVVSETEVLEAQGTTNGVKRSKLSASKWTYWGLGKGIEFEFIPGETQSPVSTTTPVETAKPSTTINYPTLKRGAKGDLVTQLQRLLSKDGSNLAIDGIFGPGTQSAVKAFQKRHGLVVDGIVGPKTWGELLKLV